MTKSTTPAVPALHPWTRLLLQAQSGSAQAFADLVELSQKTLFGFIFRKVRDRHLTEDVLAETYLKAWRTLPTYKPERCQANTWLFMIARRLVIDYLRKKGRRGETFIDQNQEGNQADGLVDPRTDGLVKRTDQEHLAARVREALDKLPDRYAEALDLMYLQGLGREEVASVLGCSVNAASSLLTRARDRLQEELKDVDL